MMADHDVGAIPIVDEIGHVQGIVTDRDICCRVVAQGKSLDTPARECMSGPAHCVDAEADLVDLEAVMAEFQVRRVPVVNESHRLVGLVSACDLIRHCHGVFKDKGVLDTLESISSPIPTLERV
jgi:CBS domain-containing protein